MNNIENRIVKNINSLIFMLRSKGIKQLSATKFLLFINKEYNIQLDQEALEELLSDNESVVEIIDDKIMIGAPEQADEEEYETEPEDEMTEEDEYNSIDDEEDYADDDLGDLTILNEDELDSEE